MSYVVAYMTLLAIVNFLFTCGYATTGAHKMAIASGATTAFCALGAIVGLGWLLPS